MVFSVVSPLRPSARVRFHFSGLHQCDGKFSTVRVGCRGICRWLRVRELRLIVADFRLFGAARQNSFSRFLAGGKIEKIVEIEGNAQSSSLISPDLGDLFRLSPSFGELMGTIFVLSADHHPRRSMLLQTSGSVVPDGAQRMTRTRAQEKWGERGLDGSLISAV
jgi:hypothetical protein